MVSKWEINSLGVIEILEKKTYTVLHDLLNLRLYCLKKKKLSNSVSTLSCTIVLILSKKTNVKVKTKIKKLQ